ncbi:MAG: hypothetical protein R2867_24140 [Caldilineaceae bacterium]
MLWHTSNALGQALHWAPDGQVPGYREDTFPPFLLADQNRTIHAFADQAVRDGDRQKAIIYRQWTLQNGWTTPIDILLLPNNGSTQTYGAFLDTTGVIHIAFWGSGLQSSDLYYAQAPATEAYRAPAWSTPKSIGAEANTPASGALAGDDKGNLVIIYSGTLAGNGVYATQSTDGGASWTAPLPIFLTYDPTLVPFSLHSYLDHAGQLHAVWNIVSATGVDEALYYARLDVAQQQWSEPIRLDKRIEKAGFWPLISAITGYDDTVVIMYNSGNPATDGPVEEGRPIQRVRLSNNGGQSWSEPIGPFAQQLGRSGEHALVSDSNNNIHTIFMQRIETKVDGQETVIDGPWHSELRGTQWRDATNFPTMIAPHDMRAVVSQGNVLLTVWREDPGAGKSGVWYSYALLNAPELPPCTNTNACAETNSYAATDRNLRCGNDHTDTDSVPSS